MALTCEWTRSKIVPEYCGKVDPYASPVGLAPPQDAAAVELDSSEWAFRKELAKKRKVRSS